MDDEMDVHRFEWEGNNQPLPSTTSNGTANVIVFPTPKESVKKSNEPNFKYEKSNPNSTILKEHCKACGSIARETSRERDDDFTYIYLQCGHTLVKESVQILDASTITSLSGKKPYPFQSKGIQFLEASGGRAMICDEMGLGKTVQALGFLKLHKEQWPFMIIAKSSLLTNWFHETLDWLGIQCQVLTTSTDIPLVEGILPDIHFKGFIISIDTLARAKWVDDENFHRDIKTIIVDECQTIKNLNAKRTHAVRKLCNNKQSIFMLSGTPIKNHAGEFFPSLNILNPSRFWGYQPFLKEWVNVSGYRIGGIRDYKLQAWNDLTSTFIIRRTKDEVLPDLPKIRRNFLFCELGKEVNEAYSRLYRQFESDYNNDELSENERSTNLLGYMSRMRHLTGLAKVGPCIDQVEEFLDSTDRKLTIFCHHKDVAEILKDKIGNLCKGQKIPVPLMFNSELTGVQRGDLVNEFRDGSSRILIASTLAAGEGINLQFCQDAIFLERQWNPANEEQAEGRFSRIGAMFDSVSVIYHVAKETIDELFAELVEKKRQNITQTMEGKIGVKWDQTSIMKELMSDLISKGRKRWSPLT